MKIKLLSKLQYYLRMYNFNREMKSRNHSIYIDPNYIPPPNREPITPSHRTPLHERTLSNWGGDTCDGSFFD